MKNTQPRRRQAPRARKGGPTRPARSKHTVFRQVCNLIPGRMIPVLAREHKIDARGFSEASHIMALIYGYVSHALSLNDICDALPVQAGEFLRIRDATPPKRNTFSNANRTRDPVVAETLYWQVLNHLQSMCPGFTEAVKWQVWTVLLTHLLLRFLRHVSRWSRSFSRCVGIVRSALWVKTDLGELLACYGTARLIHPENTALSETTPPQFQHTLARISAPTPEIPCKPGGCCPSVLAYVRSWTILNRLLSTTYIAKAEDPVANRAND